VALDPVLWPVLHYHTWIPPLSYVGSFAGASLLVEVVLEIVVVLLLAAVAAEG
jgi:hypothetical protein